jgi:uncharacterized protein (DUF2249 family)
MREQDGGLITFSIEMTMSETEAIKTVDVRGTAPMHRYDEIMSAYEALASGHTMQLFVDHDPKCMYYTLRATRGEDTFAFKYVQDGPETWEVLVTRRS